MTLAEQADAATARDALAAAARLMGLCGMSEAAIAALACDNKNAAPERWNSRRPLTRSSDYGREGLAMKATRISAPPCVETTVPPANYQDFAATALLEVGRAVQHYSWITPTCGNERCVEPDHLEVHSPVRIPYPRGLCIYCGQPGGTRDHLMPRAWTGETARRFTVTVPACGACNTRLGATLTESITERRALVHARIAKKHKRTLRAPDRTREELMEFGPSLRAYILEQAEKKAELQRMLAWPDDPSYDLRALERAGIEDGYAVGVLVPLTDEVTDWARSMA